VATDAGDSGHTLTIGITASFTEQPLIRPLRAALADAGVSAEVTTADYNQVHQTLLDPVGGLGTQPDRLLVLWRIEDVFEQALTTWLVKGGDASGLVDDVRQLGALVRTAAKASSCPLVVTVPPPPAPAWLDPLDTRTSVRTTVLHGNLVSAFLDGVADAPVTMVDLAALLHRRGVDGSYDVRNDLMYHQPFTSSFAKAFGSLLGEAVLSIGRPVPKVLAVDADNTLWGGILGEDGADGVQVGDSFPGNAYRALQHGLAYQAANGALLALLSKNNPEDMGELFATRADMALGAEDFAAQRVNWESKADNMQSVAQELNLGVDSFVFIDDNDVELDEVRQRVPGVDVVKVTDEPSEIATLTAGLTAFRFARVSDEDRQRTAMMQIEAGRREAAAEAPTHEEFLRSLGLEVHVFTPSDAQVPRVSQLINKTNQFNLTTIRRDEAAVSQLLASSDHRLYAAEVSDRFGGYGLVAVAIVDCAGDTWEIDTFLMSCRVLRRGVEDTVLQCICDDAAAAGANTVRGRYAPTAKNAQVATLYPDRGFVEIGEGRFEVTLPVSLGADHVRLLRDA